MRREFAVMLAMALAFATAAAASPPSSQTARDNAVPRYAHILVILEENKNYEQILDPAIAPNMAAWALKYGVASHFYGEVHPSEANYVALLGGDTFGIHDDDAFYCKPGQIDPNCLGAAAAGYVDHTVHGPYLGQQLEGVGLSWKAYLEDLPAPGSLAANAKSVGPVGPYAPATSLYASKHAGFVNFASVQNDPRRAEHLVDFEAFDEDVASGRLPSFALVVPNQCNEMHGLRVAAPPPGCDPADSVSQIRRGDAELGKLVAQIQASPAWRSDENVAIVITFDEGGNQSRDGCCSVTPNAPSNFGGGHIPTLVITNHGPRGVTDDTAYNHYSLLRTIEDAFGIAEHLGRAADSANGVVAMTPLFAAVASAK